MAGDRTPSVFLKTPFRETQGAFSPDGRTGRAGKALPTRILGGGLDAEQGRQYDVARDGRFLIDLLVAGKEAAPITLLQNWHPEVKK